MECIIRLLKLYGRKIFRRRIRKKNDLVVVEWTSEGWIFSIPTPQEKLTFKSLTELEIYKIRTKVNEICAKP
jgi:hypothetical protein